jgi:2-polyprenyl-3-methyl-5-hydroxy-6-metoxy-1,4-benzoquinol methylase
MDFKLKMSNLIKIKRCKICNSKNTKVISQIFYKNKFIFLETSICKICLFAFRSKTPSFKWIKKQFLLRSKIQSNSGRGINYKYEKFRIERYKKLYNFLKNKAKLRNIFEIGCATGHGLNYFKKKGCNVEGIDLDNTRIKIAKKIGIKAKKVDINKFCTKKKYSTVFLIHTLEHLYDIKKIFLKIKNLLAEDGFLYLEIPDIKYNVKSWHDSLYMGHQNIFCFENIIYFLKKNNFNILYRSYPQTENGEINIGLLCNIKESNLLKKNLKLNNKLKLKSLINKYKVIKKNTYIKKNIIKINTNNINDLSLTFVFNNNKKLNPYLNRDLSFNTQINKYEIIQPKNNKLSLFNNKNRVFNMTRFKEMRTAKD